MRDKFFSQLSSLLVHGLMFEKMKSNVAFLSLLNGSGVGVHGIAIALKVSYILVLGSRIYMGVVLQFVKHFDIRHIQPISSAPSPVSSFVSGKIYAAGSFFLLR
jgi:hypothetical protein